MGLNTSQQEAGRHPCIWHISIVHLSYVVLISQTYQALSLPSRNPVDAVRTTQITCHESLEKGEKISSQGIREGFLEEGCVA